MCSINTHPRSTLFPRTQHSPAYSKHSTSAAGRTRRRSAQSAAGTKEGTLGSPRVGHVAVGSVAQELGQAGEAFQVERTGRAKSGGHGLLRGSSHPYPVAVLSSFYSDKSQRFPGDVKYSGILQALKSVMVEFRNRQTLQIIKHVAPRQAAPPPMPLLF